jgi:hypothetical protein
MTLRYTVALVVRSEVRKQVRAPTRGLRFSETGANLCRFSSAGCLKGCLHTAGVPWMLHHKLAGRKRKTEWFVALRKDLQTLCRHAERRGLSPAVRLNGTSDISWELIAPQLFADFQGVRFYDYTKDPGRLAKGYKLPTNYHLTFSRSENTSIHDVKQLARRHPVAVVFEKIPSEASFSPSGRSSRWMVTDSSRPRLQSVAMCSRRFAGGANSLGMAPRQGREGADRRLG